MGQLEIKVLNIIDARCNHETHFSVIFVKTFSIVTVHDPTEFQKQVVSETLCSVMYNNNGGSSNKYDCQFFEVYFFKHMKEISQNKFLLSFYR